MDDDAEDDSEEELQGVGAPHKPLVRMMEVVVEVVDDEDE
jgi:hypothetical protein